MKKEEFTELVNNLFAYFQKVPPKSKAVDLWFKRISFIPLDTAKWIARHIADSENSAPYNIAKAFLKGFDEHKKAYPFRYIKEFEQTECSDCSGIGLLFFMSYNKKLKRDERVMCKCGACSNWKRHIGPNVKVPTFDLKQLQENGFEIL